MKTILFLCLFFLCSVKPVNAISGYVSGYCKDGVTITAYQVECGSEEEIKVGTTKTCKCGHYCFEGLTPGKVIKKTAEKDNCTFYPEFIYEFLPREKAK